MSGKWTIRFAREADVPGLLNIYRAYIGTPVTFEYELPSEAEFAARVAEYAARYPYLVCEAGGRLLGYAYAHRLFTREAYQWIAELTVYLAPEAAGRGLGKTLYGLLLRILRMQGVRTAYAIVTRGNAASEALHRALGFRTAAVFRDNGYKDGWHDVIWFEKSLAPCEGAPAPLRPVGELDPAALAALAGTLPPGFDLDLSPAETGRGA